MKILFVGDIVGKPGRRAVQKLLPRIVEEQEIDLVIANCENAAGGFGVTEEVIEELYKCGIYVLTSGNHIWDKKDVMNFIDHFETLLRPANYPDGLPGRGAVVTTAKNGTAVGILNLEGRVFMRPLECPFRTAKKEVAALQRHTSIIIVDMHAEATSEKQALGWFLDGKVSLVVGTHTHVQTADERILPNGTAYITDAGMTGSFNSVLGIKTDIAIERFLTLTRHKFDVARGDVWLQGVVVDVDDETGKSSRIERVNVKLDS